MENRGALALSPKRFVAISPPHGGLLFVQEIPESCKWIVLAALTRIQSLAVVQKVLSRGQGLSFGTYCAPLCAPLGLQFFCHSSVRDCGTSGMSTVNFTG